MSLVTYIRNNPILPVLLRTLALGMIAGCKEIKTEYSCPLNTDGIVAKKVHIEERYLNPADEINPLKDFDPFFDIKKGRFATKQNEKFGVLIDTKFGRFILISKELYGLVEVNSPVIVTYREVFRSTYDDLDNDGKKDLVSRVSRGYCLLRAQPKK